MKIKVSITLLLLIILYLYLSYARIYQIIGSKNLKSPFSSNTFLLEKVPSLPTTRYAALGDSLSAGVGAANSVETIVYQYAKAISLANGNVYATNFSVPGAATKDVISYQLNEAVSFAPQQVTLFVGINDIHNKVRLEDFESNYDLILGRLLNETEANITVINLPYLGSDLLILPPYNGILDWRTKEFNKIIKTVVNYHSVGAFKNRIHIVDLYKDTYNSFRLNQGLYSSDLFHPNDEGYLIWSTSVNSALHPAQN